MKVADALQLLLRDPERRKEMQLGYLGGSPQEDAEVFSRSGEFKETLRLLGGSVENRTVADIGAGRGIASYAFAKAGAGRVYVVEPNTDDWLGNGAINQLKHRERMEVISSFGEDISLPSASVDVVYCRQVLHHARDLPKFIQECHRLLKPGGVFIACREHRSDTPEDLAAFLGSHPGHALLGDEHAFPLADYLSAIRDSGLRVQLVMGPYDSVICAYPELTSTAELDALPRKVLEEKWGKIGWALGAFSFVRRMVITKLNSRPVPGRLYSFLARKPA